MTRRFPHSPGASAACVAWAGAVIAAAALPGGVARAASSGPELRGEATLRTAIEFEDGDVQLGELLVEPELSGEVTPEISWTVIGRLRIDAADELEPGDPGPQDGVRSPVNRRLFIGDTTDLELREAYADIYAGQWFVRAGKQQVVWGQADGLRVLDQVNPLSFREFIMGDFEDRRIPLWMVNAERSFGGVTAQFLWIPDHSYDEVPADGTYAVTSPLLRPQIRPQPGQAVRFAEADRPDRLIVDDDYGVRLTGFSDGWDWSVNALYAYGDGQVLRRTTTPQAVTVTPDYERTLLTGGSVSNAFGKATVRAEVGYVTDRFVLTNDPQDTDGIFETGEASGVIGLDYQVDADLLVSGQVFAGVLTDDAPGLVRDQVTGTASLLVRQEFLNDTVEVEGLLLQSLNQGDGLVQLGATYKLTDAVTLAAGADVFYGNRQGIFGQFGEADRVTLAVTYGF